MLPPRVILATTDFSDASRPALEAAAQLAAADGATLHVLHADDPLLSAAARHAGLDPGQTRQELEAFVRKTIPQAALRATLHVVTGSTVDVILDVARQLDADVIVVGSHGRSGAARVIMGSIAEGVLRKATLPVLVMPDPAKQTVRH